MDITEEATDEEEEETEEITTQVTTTINIVEFEKKMKNKKRIFTYFPFPKSHAEAQKYCENVGEKVDHSKFLCYTFVIFGDRPFLQAFSL